MSTRKPGRSLAAVYADAADLIDRNGWYAGDFYDPTSVRPDRPPAACPLCASGAIILAAGACCPDDWRDAAAALCRFADFLVARGDVDPAMLTTGCLEDAIDAIGAWNDARESASEVTTALRAAAGEVTR